MNAPYLDQDGPSVLYKYLPFGDGLRAILKDSTLKFTHPCEFNDPFDSRIELLTDGSKEEWVKYFMRIIPSHYPRKLSVGETLAEAIRLAEVAMSKKFDSELIANQLPDHGVFCLSEVNDDILMWSHYAAKHSGVCIGFSIDPCEPYFGRALKMNYADQYPDVRLFDDSMKRMDASLLTKSSHWSYEKEWRIVEHEKGSGVFPYPNELLCSVIFGLNMEVSHRDEVINILKDRRLSVDVYEAVKLGRRFAIGLNRVVI